MIKKKYLPYSNWSSSRSVVHVHSTLGAHAPHVLEIRVFLDSSVRLGRACALSVLVLPYQVHTEQSRLNHHSVPLLRQNSDMKELCGNGDGEQVMEYIWTTHLKELWLL